MYCIFISKIVSKIVILFSMIEVDIFDLEWVSY